MYEKTKGIVLHVLKYNDKNSIAHIYTDNHGRMSFLLPQGSSRNARLRNAMFIPLSLIEFESRTLPGRDISTMKDCRKMERLDNIYSDPMKSAIAMFISELLARSIQESERNEPLFKFISMSIKLLDSLEQGVANFHICFLYHFGAFMGIQPDTATYHDGYWFDMENGIFTSSCPLHGHMLEPRKAAFMMLLSRMTFSNLHRFKLNRMQRNDILDTALAYYKLHNSTIGTTKSPEVLQTLFG